MAAATTLVLSRALFPNANQSSDYGDAVTSILDQMILTGNKVAQARKLELQLSRSLCDELERRESIQANIADQSTNIAQQHAGTASDGNLHDMRTSTRAASNEWSEMLPAQPALPGDEFLSADIHEGLLANFGLSSQGLLSMIDQIGVDYDRSYDSIWGL